MAALTIKYDEGVKEYANFENKMNNKINSIFINLIINKFTSLINNINNN